MSEFKGLKAILDEHEAVKRMSTKIEADFYSTGDPITLSDGATLSGGVTLSGLTRATDIRVEASIPLSRLSKLELGPKDVLIVKVKKDQYDHTIGEKLKEHFPDNKIMVITEDIELQVMSVVDVKRDNRFIDLLDEI